MTDIRARFELETADHVMTVLHDDGLYRHLRFKAPGTSMYWFDLITVPGSLIFRGDGDSFVFARLDDMFKFFRSPVGQINPGYWAEKVTSGRDGIEKYDRELLVARVEDALTEAADGGVLPDGLREAVQEEVLDAWDVGSEHGAMRALMDFTFYVNEADSHSRHEYVDGRLTVVPAKRPDFEFYDPIDWRLRGYDWWFLWALHGIVWGIAQYDAHHGRPVQVATQAEAPAPVKARSVVTVNLPEPAAAGGVL